MTKANLAVPRMQKKKGGGGVLGGGRGGRNVCYIVIALHRAGAIRLRWKSATGGDRMRGHTFAGRNLGKERWGDN